MEQPSATNPKTKKRSFGVVDAVVLLIILVIVGILAKTLAAQLSLRHEVNTAKATTDKLITAMQKVDGKSAVSLGDKNFQYQHTATQLDGLFKQSKPYVAGKPTVVKQTANNGKAAKVVSIYYKFGSSKPFYIRITATQQNGSPQWHIINFSGNASLATLSK